MGADDLNGAIQGLLRLQDTYKLKTKDLANGIVEDININKQMDAKDCYEIGLAAYNEEVIIFSYENPKNFRMRR
ncbi:unnamed protein product [Meloidogyne enterolobii]|uniref:Uncharacterized protein n=1 Tax=Meloidogyne enterolobii TaxID=390850 RepID=A0ACB0YW78_MELEN